MGSESDRKDQFLIKRMGGLPSVKIYASSVAEIAKNVMCAYKKNVTPLLYVLEDKNYMNVIPEDGIRNIKSADNILAIFEDEQIPLIIRDHSRRFEFQTTKTSFSTLIKDIQSAFGTEEEPNIVLDNQNTLVTQETFEELQPLTNLMALFGNELWIDRDTQEIIRNPRMSFKLTQYLCGIGVGAFTFGAILHVLLK